jgi:hypothetical protein
MYNWLVKTNAECRVIAYKDEYKLKHHVAYFLLNSFLFRKKHLEEIKKETLLAKVKRLEKDNESLQTLVNRIYSVYLQKEVTGINVNNQEQEKVDFRKSGVFGTDNRRFISEFEKNEEMLKKYYRSPTPVDML